MYSIFLYACLNSSSDSLLILFERHTQSIFTIFKMLSKECFLVSRHGSNILCCSLSPKLSGSVPPAPYADHHNNTRINIPAIQSFITHARENKKDFQLKFVYSGENDVIEIQALLRQLDGWTNEDILLMPMGATPEELNLSIPKTLEHCIRNGWRFCDRLHISLFGNKQGV